VELERGPWALGQEAAIGLEFRVLLRRAPSLRPLVNRLLLGFRRAVRVTIDVAAAFGADRVRARVVDDVERPDFGRVVVARSLKRLDSLRDEAIATGIGRAAAAGIT
jgi:hypothetical protein